METGKLTGILLQNCLGVSLTTSPTHHRVFPVFKDCLKRTSFQVFDNVLDHDIIEFGSGFKLVRYRNENDTTTFAKRYLFNISLAIFLRLI